MRGARGIGCHSPTCWTCSRCWFFRTTGLIPKDPELERSGRWDCAAIMRSEAGETVKLKVNTFGREDWSVRSTWRVVVSYPPLARDSVSSTKVGQFLSRNLRDDFFFWTPDTHVCLLKSQCFEVHENREARSVSLCLKLHFSESALVRILWEHVVSPSKCRPHQHWTSTASP